ncbi:lytic transglycosylase domain-containing protein [Jiella sp. LLJ827]|uniref:lytic transglycosylase domain-containing protein n=1 Tax=Jiella sp. LLJ827 TaxID=2917712 RepID=UPI0021013651|nr:lytic transglycosylase domain-containing protein [Jiella sp. LLJ827]MCQ0989036.1 lytic transglycosylase domain-containing protein [Jiella sp. LLJ827]
MPGFAPASQLISAALALLLVGQPALAETAFLPDYGPMPTARPSGMTAGVSIDPGRFGGQVRAPAIAAIPVPAPQPAAPQSATAFTASIATLTPRLDPVRALHGELKEGLQALSDRNPTKARAIREGMAPGTLDRDILTWAIAVTGGDNVPAIEIAAAARSLTGWPGLKKLRINSEKAIYREKRPAREVLQAFSNSMPESPEGVMALARAWIEVGEVGRAKQIIGQTWRTERMNRSTENEMLSTFGTLLSKADHKHRMDMLLYADRITDAARAAKLAGATKLHAARAAAIRGERNAGSLLNAVPSSQRSDPGYLFALVEYYRKAHKVEAAADIILKAPRDPAALVDPDAWWNERRIIARDLLDLGKAKTAYQIAAGHSAQDDVEAVEAEFHAGWIALRFLNDPSTASRHFARIIERSNKPLSLSRGYYWLARAAEAAGSSNAGGYYQRAAHYGATYYGQLAAARLGRNPGAIEFPSPSDAERQRFASRPAVRAIQRLEQIGSDWRADILYRGLADELDSPGELALLSVMAEQRGDHHLVLQVGKLAYWRGVDAPALAFPIGVIPASANISASGKALAYAIARQESAFNPKARSHAGALGLLQLMPGTAKSMARKVGVAYSPARLTSDPGYNATLGARYLGDQIDNFDGSYVLTFAAYNAGPRRAREWIERFGDPRGKPLDQVIDWVERIPYTETRNYVQRIMENYQVYKIRLGAGFSIERDLRFGRRG